MRSVLITLTILTCSFGWILPTGGIAHAEEEESEAANLFRDAWWIETGMGDLEKARETYRQAVAAKGSSPIRARAQYRLAIVLERMGRTEDAMRALESLAKDFPEQRQLLTKAQARMEEWSGEDLREYFSDWYHRYQYSPAFQSKIVDLVLKLGAPDNKVSNAAREELLTIGEPALPALREHANSANDKLRSAVIDLLIKLGELPPPSALFPGRPTSHESTWHRSADFWKRLAGLDADARQRYVEAAKAHPEDRRSACVLALFEGPAAIVRQVAGVQSERDYLAWSLLPAAFEMNPSPETLASLRAIPTDTKHSSVARKNVASFLVGRHDFTGKKPDPSGVGLADLLRWATEGDEGVRMVVWPYMEGAYLRDADTWRIPAARLAEAGLGTKEREKVLGALLGQLRRADPSADLSAAVDALVDSYQLAPKVSGSNRALRPQQGALPGGTPEVPRRVFAEAIARTTGGAAQNLPAHWWGAMQYDAAEIGTVIGWISGAADAQVRDSALQLASMNIRSDIERLMAPFEDAALRLELRRTLMQGLQHNAALEALDWDIDSLTLLVETADSEQPRRGKKARKEYQFSTVHAGKSVKSRTTLSSESSRVMFRLLHNEALRGKLFEAAARAPERFTPDIWLLLGDEWQSLPENRALARSYIEKSWDGWTPEQKQAGMRVFLVEELVGKGDPALNTLLRRLMSDQELSPEGRQSAAFAISDLRLADVQSAFTLTRPDEADLAIALLPYLPRTVETYDAFKWLLNEKTESRVIIDRLYSTFGGGPEEVVPDLVRRLLSVAPAGEASDMAVALMNGRTRAEDLLLWRLALEHPSVETRVAAAGALGTLYDADSIRALAKLVDDPNPTVRDAALASLERIETIEKQKDRWREFAKDRAPVPNPGK